MRRAPGSPQNFNPNSIDAQLAVVITRLNAQDESQAKAHRENTSVLDAILTQTKATNGRVTKLEIKVSGIESKAESRWRHIAGVTAGISGTVFVVWEVVKVALSLIH
jgi:hypothetical protein